MKFLPYREKHDPNEALLRYLEHCSDLAESYLKKLDPTGSLCNNNHKSKENGIGNGIFLARPNVIQYRNKQPKKPKNGHAFGQILETSIAKHSLDILPSDLELDEIVTDPLIQTLTSPSRLEPYLGIAAENSASLNMELLFVEPDMYQQKLSVKPFLDHVTSKFPVVQFKTSTTVIKTTAMSNNSQSVNITDLTKNNSQKYDVIFVNGLTLSSIQHGLEDTISVLSSALNDKGFIVLQETCGSASLVKVLLYMCGMEMKHLSGAVDNGGKNAMASQFSKEGFDLVASCDENVLSTQYLFRKMAKNPMDHTVLYVKGPDYKWTDELKEMLKDPEKKESSLWLISPDGSYTGLEGFVSCLKLEPGGGKLR